VNLGSTRNEKTSSRTWRFQIGRGGRIIGPAAGKAIMGLLKIDFIWYLKKITWPALLGYLSGVLVLYQIG